jgi:hypothetical protein
MALQLIVDGYNFIGSANHRPLPRVASLESAREDLIEQLREYKRAKAARITLVFDAAGASGGSPRKELYKGIQVLYALAGETADDAIIRLVGKDAAGKVVVTSDRELARVCRARGASVVTSREFGERLAMASSLALKGDEEDEEGSSRRPGDKRGPSRRLASRQRRDQGRLRKL